MLLNTLELFDFVRFLFIHQVLCFIQESMQAQNTSQSGGRVSIYLFTLWILLESESEYKHRHFIYSYKRLKG